MPAIVTMFVLEQQTWRQLLLTNASCTGYMAHPFKKRAFESEKDHHPCLQTLAGRCRIRHRHQQPYARTTLHSCNGEASCMVDAHELRNEITSSKERCSRIPSNIHQNNRRERH